MHMPERPTLACVTPPCRVLGGLFEEYSHVNKYLACTAFAMPLLLSAQVLAQPAATGAAPAAPMAHSTMAPAAPATMAPSASTPGSSMATTASGTAKLSAMDKKFIMKAAQGGMAEVQLAQLAQQKSTDDNVKKFAQKMIDDHTPANQKLTDLASSKGDTPPTELSAADQKMMSKLQGMDGKKFDSTYLKGQIKSHKDMLKLFTDESKKGSDPDLKAFADQTIPTVQSHITMAQNGGA